MKKTSFWLLGLIFIVLAPINARALSSASYTIGPATLSSGGGEASSTSYHNSQSTGQTSATGIAASAGYRLQAGLWPALAGVTFYNQLEGSLLSDPSKGAITGAVLDKTTSTGVTVGGAAVTCESALHPGACPYSITYFDGSNLGGTATYDNGRFFVLNVDDGDTVTLNAGKKNLVFSPAVVVAHADTVSTCSVIGTIRPATLADLITSLRILAGEHLPPPPDGVLQDIQGNGHLGLDDVIYAMQVIAGARTGITATGSSDPLAGPGPVVGGTPVSLSDKLAVIAVAEQQWQTLVNTIPDTDRATRSQQMVAFLLTQGAIKDAGISPSGDVVARFKDNQYYVLSDGDTVEPSPPVTTTTVTRSTLSFASTPTQVRTVEAFEAEKGDMPETRQARIVDAMGANWPTANGIIDQMLSDRGWDVTEERATVENLRSISGDGVFYLYTHGSLDYNPDTKQTWWSLWTDTKATDADNYGQYKADLDDGSLIYWTAAADYQNNEAIMETHYAFTATFITKYRWSFAPNALAFINACFSNASGACKAMRSLKSPAMETFGWSNAMEANAGMVDTEFIFDRLLGENQIVPESVPQRPFGGTEALWDAGQHKSSFGGAYRFAPWYGGKPCLLEEDNNGHDVVLATSIERMEMAERIQEAPLRGDTRLTLYGLFGDQMGKVTVGSVEIPVITWKKDKIVCQPADVPGPGFSGDVQAISLGRPGNLVPLTQWHGSVTYSVYMYPPPAPSISSQIQCDVYFRGDIHSYRDYPHGSPYPYKPMAFRAAQGSSCHWQVTGGPPAGTTWVKPTSADLPFGLNGTVNQPFGTGYIFSGVVAPDTGKVALSFDFLDCVTAFQAFPVPPQNLATYRENSLLAQQSGIGPDGYGIFSNNLPATIGTDFLIPAETKPGTTPVLDAKIVLGNFVPSAAPDPAKGEDQR